MKSIIKIIIFQAVIFIGAGIITFLIGEFTAYRYGSILLLGGIVPIAIGAARNAGPRYRPMPYVVNKQKASVSERHAMDKKAILSETSFFVKAIIIGIVPIVAGLLLMHFLYQP